jgi:DNA-binding GntR family transcriptional regulator
VNCADADARTVDVIATGDNRRKPLIRVKTSDVVAERLLEMLFAGELRAGDRIDLDAIAAQLGVSRAPVREALLALERDGIITVPYHRGAFVAQFDGSTVREAFELYALLSAVTTGRVARHHDEALLERLAEAVLDVEEAEEIDVFERAAREFRRIINTGSAGPHLRALLSTFSGLVPVASRLSMDRSLAQERQLIAQELEAIRRGDADAAQASAIEHVRMLCDDALQTLREHGVIDEGVPALPQDDLPGLFAAFGGEE